MEYGKNNYVEFFDNEYGSLIINLADKNTDEPLAGGHFKIVREDDQITVYDGSTDATGTINVGELIPGWYTVAQTFAPNKYTIYDEKLKVEILSGKQQTLYFHDVTAGPQIEKVDALYPQLMLQGARFKLTCNEDNIVIGEYVTGGAGETEPQRHPFGDRLSLSPKARRVGAMKAVCFSLIAIFVFFIQIDMNGGKDVPFGHIYNFFIDILGNAGLWLITLIIVFTGVLGVYGRSFAKSTFSPKPLW